MNDEFRAVITSRDRAREPFITAMAHAAAMLDNGENVLVTVGPALEPIGIQQRKFFHGPVLTQIAEQVKLPDGSRYTAEIWKEYLKRQLLPPKWKSYRMPGAKRATPHRLPLSTETLGVKAYAKFIDQCIDYATLEWRVVFRFELSEREAVRYQPPARKTTPTPTPETSDVPA